MGKMIWKWVKLLFNILFSISGWVSSILSLYKVDELRSEIRLVVIFFEIGRAHV